MKLFIQVLAFVSLCLFAAAARNEHSPLFEAYKKSSATQKSVANIKTTQVISPLGNEHMDARDKSLFFPPLPGQNGVDYHPQLRNLAEGNSTQMIYYSWHIHVYFFHEDKNVTDRALALRDTFIKRFSLATCDDDCFMGGPFDTCTQGMCVWDPIYGVDGPHPYGQWGVYMPNEYLAPSIAWLSNNHGEFDVLFHPNTGYMVGDHDSDRRAIWIKQMVPLDLDFLIWLQCKWFECSDEVTLKLAQY